MGAPGWGLIFAARYKGGAWDFSLFCAARRSTTRMRCPQLQGKSCHGLRGSQKLAQSWKEGWRDGTPCSFTAYDHRGDCDACARARGIREKRTCRGVSIYRRSVGTRQGN